jgi:hypothetical protein
MVLSLTEQDISCIFQGINLLDLFLLKKIKIKISTLTINNNNNLKVEPVLTFEEGRSANEKRRKRRKKIRKNLFPFKLKN